MQLKPTFDNESVTVILRSQSSVHVYNEDEFNSDETRGSTDIHWDIQPSDVPHFQHNTATTNSILPRGPAGMGWGTCPRKK